VQVGKVGGGGKVKKLLFVLAACLLFTACNAPDYQSVGGTKGVITLDGHTYYCWNEGYMGYLAPTFETLVEAAKAAQNTTEVGK
jgi:hypothetical protein